MSYGEKMTTKNEHLSAVFDGEAGDFEQRRLVDELMKDTDLQQSWSNYALIGDVLREPEATQVAGADFLSKIQQELENEEEYSQIKAKFTEKKSAWSKPLAGYAIAATITAISVFSVQSLMTADNAKNSPVTQQVALLEEPQAVVKKKENLMRVASNDTVSRNVVDLEQRIKMQRYIISHIQNASSRTIAPTMRAISYNY